MRCILTQARVAFLKLRICTPKSQERACPNCMVTSFEFKQKHDAYQIHAHIGRNRQDLSIHRKAVVSSFRRCPLSSHQGLCFWCVFLFVPASLTVGWSRIGSAFLRFRAFSGRTGYAVSLRPPTGDREHAYFVTVKGRVHNQKLTVYSCSWARVSIICDIHVKEVFLNGNPHRSGAEGAVSDIMIL